LNWFEERQKEKEQFANQQLSEVIDKSSLTPQELWMLTERNFLEWRRKHDLPRIIEYFESHLPHFQEWKKGVGINVNHFIKAGKLTPFLEPKLLADKYDPFKYLYLQTYNGENRYIVSYGGLEKSYNRPGEEEEYHLIRKFITYTDWLRFTGKERVDLLNIRTINAPDSAQERVFSHNGLELLKMGGIDIPKNAFQIMLRGKYLEFVNLGSLKLNGTYYFGEEGNLECHYCYVRNMTCENLELALPRFHHCDISNIKMKNSNIQSWKLVDCQFNGMIEYSTLNTIQIYGGRFNPIMRFCEINNVEVMEEEIQGSYFGETFRLLKNLYNGQGEDDLAKKYFVREMEFKRKRINFKKSPAKYIEMQFDKHYWEYGTKPELIIYQSFITIFIFGIIFYLYSIDVTLSEFSQKKSFFECLYYSMATFTTLGFYDGGLEFIPKIFFGIESLIDALNMGFLVASLSKSKY
jgi:hypothetical protein